MNASKILDRRLFVACCCVALMSGCGTSSSAAAHNSAANDSSVPAQDSSAGVGHGTGTGAGTVEGHPYGTVHASYLIGQSDDPVNTTVIYLFDAPVACSEINAPGWDSRIADGTGALEIKLLGTKAGEYPVSSTPTGAAGQSLVNFTVSSKSATPKEETSNAGSVKLDSIVAATSAAGSFDLTFPSGSLKGTFAAAWCADGHEP